MSNIFNIKSLVAAFVAVSVLGCSNPTKVETITTTDTIIISTDTLYYYYNDRPINSIQLFITFPINIGKEHYIYENDRLIDIIRPYPMDTYTDTILVIKNSNISIRWTKMAFNYEQNFIANKDTSIILY